MLRLLKVALFQNRPAEVALNGHWVNLTGITSEWV